MLSVSGGVTPALTPDPGGTLATAYNLGDLVGAQSFSDSVGGADTADIYRFTMPMAGHFYGRLRVYNANAEIDLLQQVTDSTGQTITFLVDYRTATAGATDQDFASGDFDRVLQAGTYFIEVAPLTAGGTTYLTRMTADYAGQTLGTARDIGSAVHDTYGDFVGNFGTPSLDDFSDIYKVKLDALANVTFDLENDNGYTDPNTFKSHFEVITDLNHNGVIDNGEIEITSQSGVASIVNYTLNTGIYYIRVVPDLNYMNYHLTVVADYAGDTESRARDLGVPGNGESVQDFVSSATDFRDTYKFHIDSAREFFASLSSSEANIDVQLFRDINNNGLIDNGEFITSTVNQGAHTLLADVPAGNYFLHVDAFSGGAGKYSMYVEAPDDTGNTLGTAGGLGTISGRYNTSLHDAYLSVNDSADFRKFTLPAAGTIIASINPYLGGSADISLIRDNNNNGVVDPADVIVSNSGASEIRSTQPAGTYFIRVRWAGGLSVTRYFISLVTDLAGDTLSQARPLAAISGANPPTQTFNDNIEQDFGAGSDVQDFYTFTLPSTYAATIKTTGVEGEDSSLAIIKDANNNGVVDAGDVIASSDVLNSPNETINKTLGAGKYFIRVAGVNGETNYALTAKFVSSTPPAPFAPLRINAGGGAFTDSLLNGFQADGGFTGGTANAAAYNVAGTTDDALYYDYRAGANFTFSKTVPNGTYKLRLLFADPVATAAGKRKFNVTAEGATLLSNYDLFASVGPKTAVIRTFDVNVTDGKLDLGFKGVVGNALVSGIILIKSDRPIVRISAGGPAYTDSYQNVWSADSGFIGGSTQNSSFAVNKTVDDPLFYSNRAGSNFSFSKAVANGQYQLRLIFADSAATAAGQRKFNVTAEGTAILSNFDIFATAGGAKTAVSKTFTVNITDGKLDLSFKGVVGNALISGIELIPV